MQYKTYPLLACLLLTVSILMGGCRKKEKTDCTDLFPVTVETDCDNSAQGQDELRRDAMGLAMSFYTQFEIAPIDAFIPESVWMPYFTTLVAVRTAIPRMACEDLNSLLEIEQWQAEATYQIRVEVDTSFAWTAAWRNGNSQTGDPAIDSLMTKYSLSLADHYSSSFAEYSILNAAEPLNMPQLAREFVLIDGVLDASLNLRVGDGDNLEAQYSGPEMLLRFSKGYGDCPSGCINRDTWTFRVDEDCVVTYESFESR
jgi:transposase